MKTGSCSLERQILAGFYGCTGSLGTKFLSKPLAFGALLEDEELEELELVLLTEDDDTELLDAALLESVDEAGAAGAGGAGGAGGAVAGASWFALGSS